MLVMLVLRWSQPLVVSYSPAGLLATLMALTFADAPC